MGRGESPCSTSGGGGGGWAGTPAIIFIYMTNSNGHACVSSVILSYGMYELALFCPCA